jgi:hypothetical protein
MGGKPSKGTKRDKRLKANKPRRRRKMPQWLQRRIRD